MTEYVAGFLFDKTYPSHVALICKERPAWQKGKWNAIGGHIEDDGETPLDAMRREFKEETDLYISDWKLFCTLAGSDWKVNFFVAYDNDVHQVKTATDEEVGVFDIDNLPMNLMTNVRWLINMALSMEHERAASFNIQELVAA